MNRKFLKWAAMAFLVWYVINNPDGAGATVQKSLGGLGHAADSIATFMNAALPK